MLHLEKKERLLCGNVHGALWADGTVRNEKGEGEDEQSYI